MKRSLIIQPVVSANGACWRRQAVSVAAPPPCAHTVPSEANSSLANSSLAAPSSDQQPVPDTDLHGESCTLNRRDTINPRRPA